MTGDRHTILIVDDAELNRTILAEMLKDKYDVIEAENGQVAVDIMKEHLEDLSLVLLDMNMPVMDGNQVLAYMKQMLWLEKLQVIIISADTTDATIQEAYELGATDYFTKPFDRNTVRRRVSNTIALYDRNNVDINNSMEALSHFFRRIIKVNLNTGRYLILQNNVEDLIPKDYPNIYAWLDGYLYNGYVYEDDKAAYIDFCKKENIITAFAEGAEKISLQYRRNVNAKYQWAVMELIRSKNYSQDEPIVVLYVRAIDNEYVKHIEAVMRKNSDSVGLVSLNITRGVCVASSIRYNKLNLIEDNEPIDDYIGRASQYIVGQDRRDEIINHFSLAGLHQAYEAGATTVTRQTVVRNNNELFIIDVSLEFFKNPLTSDIEGILTIDDATKDYLSSQINDKLYRKDYDKVMLIDINRRDILERKATAVDGSLNKGRDARLPYDQYVDAVLEKYVAAEDRHELKKLVELDHIVEELDKAAVYRFSAYQMYDVSKQVKEYSFIYLDRELGIIMGSSQDMTKISFKDLLTGGLNRQGFLQELNKLMATAKKSGEYAVLFFDIRNFKAVNELFGMSAGDLVLKENYKRMQSSNLEPMVLSRLEADHFALLVKREQVDLDEIKRLCQMEIVNNGKTLKVYLECGIYVVKKDDNNAGEMVDRAGVAKSFIQGEGASPYKIYEDSMKNAYMDRATLVNEVMAGIKQEQFMVYYQPVVDAKTGKVVSAEALVRWHHPDRGFVSPGFFIPALEKQGHITELDAFVARKVEEFLTRQINEGMLCVPVSLNLSWVDFFDQQFMTWILGNVEECKKKGIRPRIEITESSCAAISQDRNTVLKQLRKLGAELLMDDFGTGYSSFGMLQNYHFDILKIDIEFVRQLADNARAQSITEAIIAMAHGLGMKVIAEGAEDPEQIDFLRNHGCDYIQGYYFYKPMPEAEFRELLKNQ